MVEYLDDELTDNSYNKKHMYKAELRAGRKCKVAEAAKNQKVKGATGFAQYPVRGDSMALANQAVQAASIQRTVAPASVSSLGPCFQCEKLGHFR